MGRVRVFRVHDGRRRYRFRCTSCGRGGENDGRRRICKEKPEVTLLQEVAT